MKKVVSYRQKLIELARIYKIDQVFNKDLKLTTYEIELTLLKNKVPIPSRRRGYFSHKINTEFLNPFYIFLKKNLSIDINIDLSKILKKTFDGIISYFSFIIRKTFDGIISYFGFIIRKTFDGINSYFGFIFKNITNFFRILSKAIIEGLNNIYNFKVKESYINKIVSRGAYASVFVILVFSGFYVKGLLTNVDSLKISLEIKSDKNNNSKVTEKKTAKVQKKIKEENSRGSKDKKIAKVQKKIKKNNSDTATETVKKYNPETDYTLNTQTVLNLFEDLEYDLDTVRDNKTVKPIYFTRLPKDLVEIKSVKEKKETFLQILLPLVVAENEQIKNDRKYLLKIIKQNQSEKNKAWLNKKYKKYKISNKNIEELIEKIDIIPTSIALAQAAKESGWGTSRFALEGNAIFGQWTWNGVGIEPLEKTENQRHKILKFPLLRASVKAYISNLNTHSGYKGFRKKRSQLRTQNKNLSGLALIHELDNYAQTGKEYTKILQKIIEQNDLDEFETVIIDDYKEINQLKL